MTFTTAKTGNIHSECFYLLPSERLFESFTLNILDQVHVIPKWIFVKPQCIIRKKLFDPFQLPFKGVTGEVTSYIVECWSLFL